MNKYFLYLLCLLLFACDQTKQPKTSQNTRELLPDHDHDINPNNKPESVYGVLITEADKLRLRSEPNLNGEILETLPINTVLRFLNERSEKQETITIKGLDHKAYWLKVKTTVGKEGWVYGSKGIEDHGPMIRFMKEKVLSNENPAEFVSEISASQLEALTGLQGIHRGWGNYSGYYQFTRVQGVKELNGKMEFVARHYLPSYQTWLKVVYSGEYKGGFPIGKIKEDFIGVEGGSITLITYEGGTYKCSNITQKWDAEGESGSNVENTPTLCGFDQFK